MNPTASQLVPVFDAHTDALQRGLDLGHDLGAETPGQFDLVRGARGGLGAVVLVSWVDPAYEGAAATERARALMSAGHELARRHPDKLGIARTVADFEEQRERGAVAALLGIEGGHALNGSIAELERFHAEGLRVLTLVWNNHLPWIRSCQDGAGAGVPEGLSDLGRDIVRRMNELGVVVDLSHAGVRSFYDALEVSARPVIASHSGCTALHDHPRNMNDEQLRALAANDGVIGIVFHPGFLDADARAEEIRVRKLAGYRACEGANATAKYLAESVYMESAAEPMSIDRVVEHIEHACEVAGPRHVGLGSDFDGIERGPEGLEDASRYNVLAECMRARGHDEPTIRGVLFENMARVVRAVLPG